jgi:hypothetical protein
LEGSSIPFFAFSHYSFIEIPFAGTYSVVLSECGDRQSHGQSAEEAVDAIGQEGSLDPTPVDRPARLDLGHLGGGSHVSDDLHS